MNNKHEKITDLHLKGKSNSPGIAIGSVFIHKEIQIDLLHNLLAEGEIKAELIFFRESIKSVINSLKKNYEKSKAEYGESFAEIFLGQIAILEDRIFLKEVEDEICKSKHSAEAATFKIFSRKREFFLNLENEYFKDRAFDIYDLKHQIIAKLRGENRNYTLTQPSIIVGVDITPSDTVHFKRENILGFITEMGGKTSHSAILARSLNIPSISGIKNILSIFDKNQEVILDGRKADVIINPTDESKAKYLIDRYRYEKYLDTLREFRDKETKLKDGTEIHLAANIEFIEDIESMKRFGLKNVGLYRSEGYFLKHDELPDEETQFLEYERLKNELKTSEIIIRTLDIGGDKLHDKLSLSNEENPFLGWRAIRLCLDEIGMFRAHLRAILRASDQSNFKILLPMLTDVSELWEAKSLIQQLSDDLKEEGIAVKFDIPVGIMIETPAIAYAIEDLIDEVDFISIGSNDLIQYFLAVDRGNEKVSYLYQAQHPSFLRLVEHVISVAKKHGKEVGMCGEMAGEMLSFPILIGMGLRHFSMTARKSLELKRMLMDLDLSECEELYKKLRKMKSYIEVNSSTEQWFLKKFPDLDIN